jgi:membrane protein implicated in regulation of membrane protease activity
LRVFGKYLLLQAPGLVLVALVLIALEQWAGLPRWSVYVLLLVLLLKDLVLFPFVRRAYEFESSSPVGAGRLVGARGISTELLDPFGYVRVGGELWRAEASPSIPQGSPVRVREVRGLTLIVEADDAV